MLLAGTALLIDGGSCQSNSNTMSTVWHSHRKSGSVYHETLRICALVIIIPIGENKHTCKSIHACIQNPLMWWDLYRLENRHFQTFLCTHGIAHA